MAARAHARRDEEEVLDASPSAPVQAPPPLLDGHVAMTPALLSAFGNQAVARAVSRSVPGRAVLARTAKTGDELLDLTVADFDEHRKGKQMDWVEAAGLKDAERKAIWGVIDWGLDG